MLVPWLASYFGVPHLRAAFVDHMLGLAVLLDLAVVQLQQ